MPAIFFIRTLDSLNEGLPIKMARKKVLKKSIVFPSIRKTADSRNFSAKCVSHWTCTYLKKWVENPVFEIQHTENRKGFTEVHSSVIKLILLHTFVVNSSHIV